MAGWNIHFSKYSKPHRWVFWIPKTPSGTKRLVCQCSQTKKQVSKLEQQIKEVKSLIEALDVLEERHASKGEMWHSMIRYLDVKARAKGIPIRGAFELTPFCNLDCKMCYVHLNAKQVADCGKTILSGEQWIELIDQAADAGLMYALLTGGEAMLHPEFERIYLHLLNKGMLVTVNTNGILLTQERIDFFKQHPPTLIQITLYGSNEDEYEKVTGTRAFSHVMDAIKRLKEAKLFFEVGVTPSRYMDDYGKSVLKLLDSMSVFFSMNAGLFEPRKETGRAQTNHDLSLDEYIDLYRFRAKLHGKEYVPVCQEDISAVGGNCNEEPKGFRCAGGRSSFAIKWDGTLQPCLMVTDIKNNLLDIPFADGWKKIHKAVMEYPFPAECIGCAYQQICTVCVKQHALGAPLGHANKMLCERAKRLALEGMIKIEV